MGAAAGHALPAAYVSCGRNPGILNREHHPTQRRIPCSHGISIRPTRTNAHSAGGSMRCRSGRIADEPSTEWRNTSSTIAICWRHSHDGIPSGTRRGIRGRAGGFEPRGAFGANPRTARPIGSVRRSQRVPRWPNQTCPTGFVGRHKKEYRGRTPAAASVLPELLRIRRLTVWGSGGIRPRLVCAPPSPRTHSQGEVDTPGD